jgi:hypothetical protein
MEDSMAMSSLPDLRTVKLSGLPAADRNAVLRREISRDRWISMLLH